MIHHTNIATGHKQHAPCQALQFLVACKITHQRQQHVACTTPHCYPAIRPHHHLTLHTPRALLRHQQRTDGKPLLVGTHTKAFIPFVGVESHAVRRSRWHTIATLIGATCGMQVVPSLDWGLAVEAICTHNLGIVVIVCHGALAAKPRRLVGPCVGHRVVVGVDAACGLLIVVTAVAGAIEPVFCPAPRHDVFFIGACVVRGYVGEGVVQQGRGFA